MLMYYRHTGLSFIQDKTLYILRKSKIQQPKSNKEGCKGIRPISDEYPAKYLNAGHYTLNNTKLELNVVSHQDLFKPRMNFKDAEGRIMAGNRLGTQVI